MMQFVANAGHFGTANDLAVASRSGIEVENADRIVAAISGLRIEYGDIAQFFPRPLHRHLGRRIKRLIWLPKRQVVYSLGRAIRKTQRGAPPINPEFHSGSRFDLAPMRCHITNSVAAVWNALLRLSSNVQESVPVVRIQFAPPNSL